MGGGGRLLRAKLASSCCLCCYRSEPNTSTHAGTHSRSFPFPSFHTQWPTPCHSRVPFSENPEKGRHLLEVLVLPVLPRSGPHTGVAGKRKGGQRGVTVDACVALLKGRGRQGQARPSRSVARHNSSLPKRTAPCHLPAAHQRCQCNAPGVPCPPPCPTQPPTHASVSASHQRDQGNVPGVLVFGVLESLPGFTLGCTMGDGAGRRGLSHRWWWPHA